MLVRCPICDQTVAVPAGAPHGTKCPRCNAPIEPPASALPAAQKPTDDLMDGILQEFRQVERSSPPPPPTSRRVSTTAGPGIFPKPPVSFYDRRARWVPIVAVVAGIALVAAAGCFAYRYIWAALREQNVAAALQRVDADMAPLRNTFREAEEYRQQADDNRRVEDYAKAANAYRSAASLAESVLERLRADAGDVEPGPLKDRVESVASEVLGYKRSADEALNLPRVKFGSQGLVEYDGGWVTPAQKKEFFEAKMKAEGRTEHAKGEWLTEAEIHDRRGEVAYGGRWFSKAEYEKILKGETPPSVDTAPPPATPTVQIGLRLPKPSRTFPASQAMWVLDDFEKDAHEWTNVTWPNVNPVGLSIERWADSGQLLVTMKGGRSDKSAIVRPLGLDFSSRSKLTLDVFNATGEPVLIAIAIETDAFYESRWWTLKMDANNAVTFDLRVGDFKSEASRWTHSTRISHLERAGWVYILIYHDKPGKLYLDNIVALGGG